MIEIIVKTVTGLLVVLFAGLLITSPKKKKTAGLYVLSVRVVGKKYTEASNETYNTDQ